MMVSPSEYIDYVRGIRLSTTTAREYMEDVGKSREIEYLNAVGAFDTEFTSMTLHSHDREVKAAVMYAWMFGLGDPSSPVCIGRTWEEFVDFIGELQKRLFVDSDRRLLVYVHNLSAEFQFMRRWLKWDKVFVLTSHHPVYAITGGIEFRCSLKLSGGKSLATIGKELQDKRYRKLTGDLDYSLLRHPSTPLNDKELGYCENDIRVLLAYMKEKIETDGGVSKIPLTNTGYVRSHIRERCLANPNYRKRMKSLTLTGPIYLMCKEAFRGGDTHANPDFVEVFMEDGTRKYNPNLDNEGAVKLTVSSYDLTSSYPSVMVLERFPMGPPVLHPEVKELGQLSQLAAGNKCLFRVELDNVDAVKDFQHPLSRSRCRDVCGEVVDNGRIVSADHLVTTMTWEDWEIYREYYTESNCRVFDVVTWLADYLPTPFVKAMLELYEKKTTLKGVPGMSVQYMIAKNMTNSGFGMTVTDIVRDILKYDNDLGFLDKEAPNLDNEVSKYNTKRRRFLYYPWGVWVTAYARRNLYRAISEAEHDFVYCDTDSTKLVNQVAHADFFKRYNEEIMEKIKRSAFYHRLPISMYMPKNNKGDVFPIGVWEYEGDYPRFKTLGAKRYMVELTDSQYKKVLKDAPELLDHYMITAAGINKTMGTNWIIKSGKPFSAFSLGLTVPEDHSGRLVHTYCDYEVDFDLTDYLGIQAHVHEKSMLHLGPSEYKMSDMEQFVKYLRTRPFAEDTVI